MPNIIKAINIFYKFAALPNYPRCIGYPGRKNECPEYDVYGKPGDEFRCYDCEKEYQDILKEQKDDTVNNPPYKPSFKFQVIEDNNITVSLERLFFDKNTGYFEGILLIESHNARMKKQHSVVLPFLVDEHGSFLTFESFKIDGKTDTLEKSLIHALYTLGVIILYWARVQGICMFREEILTFLGDCFTHFGMNPRDETLEPDDIIAKSKNKDGVFI